jgi:hypothetical protein
VADRVLHRVVRRTWNEVWILRENVSAKHQKKFHSDFHNK